MRWLPMTLALSLCGCAARAPSGPPDLHYGRDLCDECGMIISDIHSAAGYRLPDGTLRKFDDIGDLLVFGARSGELSTAEVWVHDHAGDRWIAATDAWFVRDVALATPMGRGIAAFAGKDAAAGFAQARGTRVLRWSDLQDLSGAPAAGH